MGRFFLIIELFGLSDGNCGEPEREFEGR
jgi:hypothetical protein